MIIFGKTNIYISGTALGNNGLEEIIELQAAIKKAKKDKKRRNKIKVDQESQAITPLNKQEER
ncbi:hypothetical protein [Gynuella sp.]|uniref:hypothetical protein n=1 Tax=Gynuella sp. TaxID=2969146 RepID=UPI003D130E27